MSTNALFDLIDRLTEGLPLAADGVAQQLGARLAPNAAGSTAALAAHALAGTDPRFASIDLRLPDPDVGDEGAFLSITLGPDLLDAADRGAVIARFGGAFQADVPPPRFKPGTVPLYLVYQQDWGQLTFGIDPQAGDRVMRVILQERAD